MTGLILLMWLLGLAGLVAVVRLSTRVRDLGRRLSKAEVQVRLLKRRTEATRQAPDPEAEAPATARQTEEAGLRIEPMEASSRIEPAPTADPSAQAPAGRVEEPAREDSAGVPAGPPVDSGKRFEWERWVGVRGAAVLGGVVLALATILFLKYSIEQDLISETVRVALGFLGGAGAVIGSEVLRRRGYTATSDSVAGAGVVMLYGSVWAAHMLYTLIEGPLAWVLMVLVTAVCGLMSWRRDSLVIALLGLIGGFVTPLLLDSGKIEPIGLFGYVLLLDAGLLWLAARRGWSSLAILSLVGTLFYQATWVFFDMPADRLPFTLGILALFAMLFALFDGRRASPRSEGGRLLRGSRTAAIILPFLFVMHLASRSDLGDHLAPIAALMVLLSLVATWLGRVRRITWLARAVAAADVAVVLTWLQRTQLELALAWELVVVSLALALAFHWPLELDRWRSRSPAESDWVAPTLATVGLALLVVLARFASSDSALFWPWLVGWLALAALSVRQAELTANAWLRVGVAAAPAFAFTTFVASHGLSSVAPGAALFLGLMVAVAAAFQVPALTRRVDGPAGSLPQAREIAAAVAPILLVIGLMGTVELNSFPVFPYLVTTLVLGLLATLVATRLSSGPCYFVAMLVVAMAQALYAFEGPYSGLLSQVATASRPSIEAFWLSAGSGSPAQGSAVLLGLALQSLSVLVFTFWPFLVGQRLATDRWALYGSALAGPVWFLSLKAHYESLFGSDWIAVLPIVLGLISLVAALRASRLWSASDPAHKRSLAWFLAVALGFVSLAIPLQLENEWVTLGWALQALGLVVLWRRLDHPGLRWLALALFAAVAVRLVANPALLGYYPASQWPVFNWLMYTYLVPAAALLWSAKIQEPLEVARRSPGEAALYSGDRPVGATLCALAAVLVVFVWINLTIFDAFSSGPGLLGSFARLPARDLTLSLAWILYAVILLAVGMARRSGALRWISLAFLVLAIGKVFLYDLGELRELYRVASLAGLAVSLLLVSLAYQRFVFGTEEAEPQREEA